MSRWPSRPARGQVESTAVPTPLTVASGQVERGLGAAASRARRKGLPVPALEGHLYRPLVAAMGRGHEGHTESFWTAALAVQMVHEASLLHDDVIDQADRRRDRPSLQSKAGAARALLQGDRLLTAAYCVAQSTGSRSFMGHFVAAVEATVAGEAGQMAAMHKVIDRSAYDRIVAGKTGALFGVALAAGALLRDDPRAAPLRALGVEVGSFFQRIDDFLDYCPAAATGKPMLSDFRQKKWTWVLEGVDPLPFDLPEPDLVLALFGDGNGNGNGVMASKLHRLERDAWQLIQSAVGVVPAVTAFGTVLERWLQFCRDALTQETALARQPGLLLHQVRMPPKPMDVSGGDGRSVAGSVASSGDAAEQWVRERAAEVGGPARWPAYFARHSKTFRFAARWFPRKPRERVTAVYAFCRFTDDLVDEHLDVPATVRRARLDAWGRLTRRAYEGEVTGVELADVVMTTTAKRGVSYQYVDELIDGVRMDLFKRRYSSMADLRLYTFRVASVVGGWLTEMFGVSDRWVLDRAYALGHAMQMTNIIRDVGEDLEADRLYLPADRMQAHGVAESDLREVQRNGGPMPSAYVALIAELLGEADRHYQAAFAAIPSLPWYFQRPVAVAAAVYRGIHAEIVANRYDNLTTRAHTKLWTKLRLGAGALRGLRERRKEQLAAARAAPDMAVVVGEPL